MFGYYLNLALRSFKRNKALTALMVLAIALGIGACMTTPVSYTHLDVYKRQFRHVANRQGFILPLCFGVFQRFHRVQCFA